LRMEPRQAWSTRLRRFARSAGVLSHPFMAKVKVQESRRILLETWAIQDYFVSKRFPCMLGSLISHIEDPTVRHPLVENLWEEHGEGASTKSHHALYCDLLESMGMSRVVDKRLANEATLAFVDVQESLARQDVFMGLGAFCYANEYITIAEFGPLEEAVQEGWLSSWTSTGLKPPTGTCRPCQVSPRTSLSS
jgi:pyrroloquinoline-quinone synthase